MGEYKYFCSLGTLCQPARMMQRIHVKKVSYPFDWCFTDDNIVTDCLNDNFTKFLDRQYYQDVKHKYTERSCGHSLYHEDFFFHKNPRNEDDYEYYKRCVSRFQEMTKSGERKLFFFLYSPMGTRHPQDVYQMFNDNWNKEDIINNLKERGTKINDALRKITNNYRLAIIMNFCENDSHSFNVETKDEIDFWTINTLSLSGGVGFVNNIDDVFLSGLMCESYLR